MTELTPRALEGVRVLDLGGSLTNYCGKLFAELGADVVLVEPPGGNDLRAQPPFADGVADDEASLSYFYHNSSKRGIVLDLDRAEGQRVLRHMAGSVDLILEDYAPGVLQAKGIGPEQLLGCNSRLVVTSITPFGQVGPYAQYEHSDLVCLALGGLLWMGGYSDGPPVRAAGDQAYMAGNLFGAVASMTALTHAELRGEGQHVDVSVQESVVMGLENAAQFYDFENVVRRRFGGTQRQAGFGVFPCADGHVFLIAGGIGGNRFWGNLVEWMRDDGLPEVEKLEGDQWDDWNFVATEEAKELFWRLFTEFSAEKRKQDLYHESQVWRVPLCPINMASDVHARAQLDSRGFFVNVEALGRNFSVPGPPYRLSETPWEIIRPAPRLGEHTAEVLTQFGLSTGDIQRLRTGGII